MTLDQIALAASAVALLLALVAVRTARSAWLLAFRTEVRRELDAAKADARGVVDRAVALAEETMQVAHEIAASGGGEVRPDEREALDLREEARTPLAELERIDDDLGKTSRRRLEAIRAEIARVRRTLGDIAMKIDIKDAALDGLRVGARARGDAREKMMVFRPGGP